MQEIFIGLTVGMVMTICFAAASLAGEKIAATSGLAFASQVDPTGGGQSPVISQILILFLIFHLGESTHPNLHHELEEYTL